MKEQIEKVNSKLFDNIGRKIKMIAKVLFWLGAAASVIGGIVCCFVIVDWDYIWVEDVLLGILGFVGVSCIGTLTSWLSATGVYAFGSFVADTAENKATLRRIEKQMKQVNQHSTDANAQ